MSEAFRCDGCDDFYGGEPAIATKAPGTHTIGVNQMQLSHDPGRNDAFPADDPTEEVTWPFHRTRLQFCVSCAAEHIVPGILEAAQQGRYME